MNHSIDICSVWEDIDLFEINIKANGGSFSGSTNCYSTRENLSKLSEDLEGFPKSLNDEYVFSTGPHDSSYFTLKFECINSVGHIAIKIKIHEKQYHLNTRYIYNEVSFESEVEPSSIDNFLKELKHLCKSEIGSMIASLTLKS